MINSSGYKWIGPFILESVTRDGIIANFVALNGLYKDDGSVQYAIDVLVRVEITPINSSNVPIGSSYTYDIYVNGSSTNTQTRAASIITSTSTTGRCRVRAARITEADTTFTGTVVDEIKWRDLYALSFIDNANFGNVTLLKSKTYATAGALTLKERKLNLLVTRQIKRYLGGGSFTSGLESTKKAADIIMHVAQDPNIGNRQLYELDLDSIYQNSYVKPLDYFGTPEATEFCYTFDKDNLSFEETMQMIGSAIFNTSYRLGNVIKMSFEKSTDDSTLLFNHRNKLPGSETRSVTFGYRNDNDGIELEYVSPDDDAVITYYLPTDRSAVNPEKIETVGVRNFRQAYFLAWRAYNKLRYQNIQVEFDATQEADMSVPTDRILVSDNTRSGTQDGEVISQTGLTIYTSQKVKFDSGITYNVFLQLYDGTVESISVVEGPTSNSLILDTAPRLPLVTDSANYAQTTYILVGNTEVRKTAFLVTEKITQDGMTSKIRAGNYDARFYEHDTDYITGII